MAMTTRRDILLKGSAALAATLAGSSCTLSIAPATRARIDAASRDRAGKNPNPLIVIPGILGSRLVSAAGETVWGSYGPGSVHHGDPDGRRALALPMRQGVPLEKLHDDVRADGALRSLAITRFLGVSAYERLLNALVVGGYRPTTNVLDPDTEHLTCFEFGYDWRRSNLENAATLGEFIREKRKLIQDDQRHRTGRTSPVKFDIVGHSMGGLLARYYLMHGGTGLPDAKNPRVSWAGARDIRRLVQVGSPNAGSMQAFLQADRGMDLVPFTARFQPAVIGTMPSVYELLPRTADQPLLDPSGSPLDILDPAVWEKYQWGLLNPDHDSHLAELLPGTTRDRRLRIARDHLTKCLDNARRFHRSLDCPCSQPPGVELHAFFGDSHDTIHRLRLTDESSPPTETTLPGDGTVTARSALAQNPDGTPGPIPWTTTQSYRATHMTLPARPEFIESLINTLVS